MTLPYLLCVPKEEGKTITLSIHNDVSGAHQGGKNLALQVQRQGYYWPQMKWDITEIAKKCKECQIRANIQKLPTSLTNIITPIPFARWGLDIIGPFPVASNGRKFLLVAIDYFTKWAKAEAVKSISQKNVVKFVFKNIICRFGVPLQIITDNGTQFAWNGMKKNCKDNEIKLSFASVCHPQTNGQVELSQLTNKIFVKILKRKIGGNPKE